jgi:hypothetical protein
MIAKVPLVLPCFIAERAIGTIDQFKALLDKRAALQGGEKPGFGFQPPDRRDNSSRVFLPDIRSFLHQFRECFDIAQRGLLVEFLRFGGF